MLIRLSRLLVVLTCVTSAFVPDDCRSAGDTSMSSAATQVPDESATTASTWRRALVLFYRNNHWLRGRLGDPGVASRLSALAAPGEVPVILYLHGCDGLHPRQQRAFWESLAREGYLVIMPDSFARAGRTERCGRQNARIYAARLAEVDFALARLEEFPWIDDARMFLYGHSEGGVAASRYAGDKFRGVIITGSSCLRYAVTVPSLAILSRHDAERFGDGCSKATERVLLHGNSHEVLGQVKARNRIRAFILEGAPGL